MNELVEQLGKQYNVFYPKNNAWDMQTLAVMLNPEYSTSLTYAHWALVLRNLSNG